MTPANGGHGTGVPSSSTCRWSGRAIRIALTIGVTWLILDRVGVSLEELFALDVAMPTPRPWVLGASILLLLIGFFVSARLWGRMAGELGGRDPGAAVSLRIWMSANLGRYVPGKVWQMAGLAVLSRRIGLSATVAATSGVVGQVFALAAAGLIGVPVLVASRGNTGRAGGVLLFALAILIVLASIPAVIRGVLAVLFRMARIPTEHVPRPGPFFGPRWLLLYLANWAIYGTAFVVFMVGLGLEGTPVGLAASFAAAYLLGYAAVFAPAGLGVREGFLILFLTPHVGAAAAGASVLARVWMTLVEVVPAGALAVWEVFRGDARIGDGVQRGGDEPES